MTRKKSVITPNVNLILGTVKSTYPPVKYEVLRFDRLYMPSVAVLVVCSTALAGSFCFTFDETLTPYVYQRVGNGEQLPESAWYRI